MKRDMKGSPKTAIIIGAAGFLGRYAARHFHEQGWSVIGIDCIPPENAPLAILDSYHDLRLPSDEFERLVAHIVPDVCVHSAGRASVPLSFTDPAADFYDGPLLTFNILNALRLQAPECRFLFLSSAAVYGNPVLQPVQEKHEAHPISIYGFHKQQCEQLCLEFARVYGLRTASCRIFSAYGTGLRRQVIWDICEKAMTRSELILQGTGQESRDFIHARDIARALEIVATTAPMDGEIYNLATGREVTIEELSHLILKALRLNITPVFNGVVPPGTPANWRADVSLLTNLGFAPSIGLEAGVDAFARWCKAEVKGE